MAMTSTTTATNGSTTQRASITPPRPPIPADIMVPSPNNSQEDSVSNMQPPLPPQPPLPNGMQTAGLQQFSSSTPPSEPTMMNNSIGPTYDSVAVKNKTWESKEGLMEGVYNTNKQSNRIHKPRPGKSSSIQCYQCRQYGHKYSDCPNPPSSGNAFVRKSRRFPAEGAICHKCREPGHIAPDCPRKNTTQRPKSYTGNKICRYWMNGHCRQGDECPYMHTRYLSMGEGANIMQVQQGTRQHIQPNLEGYPNQVYDIQNAHGGYVIHDPSFAMQYMQGHPQAPYMDVHAYYSQYHQVQPIPPPYMHPHQISSNPYRSHHGHHQQSMVAVSQPMVHQGNGQVSEETSQAPYSMTEHSNQYVYHPSMVPVSVPLDSGYPIPDSQVVTSEGVVGMSPTLSDSGNYNQGSISSDAYEASVDQALSTDNSISETSDKDSIKDPSNIDLETMSNEVERIESQLDGQLENEGTTNLSVESEDGFASINSEHVSSSHVSHHDTQKQSLSGGRGLKNSTGENSCFVNVVIQALFHMEIFQNLFSEIDIHRCEGNDRCIFCGLKSVFKELNRHEESLVSSEDLRKALSLAFSEKDSFSVGSMNDAVETHESILWALHHAIFDNEKAEEQNACTFNHALQQSPCLAHKCFGLYISEKVKCLSCHEETQALQYDTMVQYVSTNVLINCSSEHNDFSTLLSTSLTGDSQKCKNKKCRNNKLIPARLKVERMPEVFTLGFNWPSAHSTKEQLSSVLNCIDPEIDFGRIFLSSESSNKKNGRLLGMICYFGRHYVAIFFSKELNQWLCFDDAIIKEIGQSWEKAVEYCLEGNYRPLLLFYGMFEVTTKEISIEKSQPFQFTVGDIIVSACPDLNINKITTSSSTTTTTTTKSSTITSNGSKPKWNNGNSNNRNGKKSSAKNSNSESNRSQQTNNSKNNYIGSISSGSRNRRRHTSRSKGQNK